VIDWPFLIILCLVLAAANGANDVSKGIATLVGSGTADSRQALLWGTLWTVSGSIVSIFVSRGLLQLFSGTAFVQGAPPAAFMFAAATGALAWLVIATRFGLPVSTTHALVGGLVGVTGVALGVARMPWGMVVARVVVPLAASPLIAILAMSMLLPMTRAAFARFQEHCVCVERWETGLLGAGSSGPLLSASRVRVVATADGCPGATSRLGFLDMGHWASAAVTSFCRGLNDTPKVLGIAASSVAATGFGTGGLLAGVAIAMGAGSLFGGIRVTDTLAHRVTAIDAEDGVAANLSTSILVGLATVLAMPVSTTHVSASAIATAGIRRGQADWTVVRSLALAWLVTLPVSGVSAAMVYLIVAR
jgi:PiT family inorganic phosphate transporter